MSTSSGASRRNKSAAGQTGTQTGKKPGYYSTRYGVGAASTGARKEPGKPAKPGDAGYEKAQHDRRYIPALDGLRALAVLGVIAYHLGSAHVHGGLLGVTVFFVLSGYLITGILVNEYRESSTINLPKFWLRRVRRLFPAIFVVVFVVAALCVLFNHALLTKMRPDIIPSLFWFQNWWYVFRGLSYFDSLGAPSPLTHFWSLAIEEQFYVVWPLVLLLVFKLGGKRKVLGRVCLGLAAASMLLMALLYNPQADPTRVYYGTDTRAFSLLIGAWLALSWPGQSLSVESTRDVPERSVRLLDSVGTLALLGLIVMMVVADGMSPFMYRGGIALASVLTAVLVAVLVYPRSRLAKVFEARPLVWIGTRSYGMYLWHFPLILLLAPLDPALNGHSWWFCLLAIALTFGISELSFRFVEDPIRKGALGRAFAKLRARSIDFRACLHARVLVPAASAMAVLLIALVGIAAVPDTDYVPRDALVSTGAAAGQAIQVPEHQDGVYNPLLIGDSIPGDSVDEFKALFPNGLNDSYIGRWLFQARDVYKGYSDQGVVGHCVIFACFSNHPIKDGELEEIHDLVGDDRELFLVNVKVPDSFEADTNARLADFADKHDNVHLIDWYSLVKDHMGEYLWDDKEHLRQPDGPKVYEQLIYDSLKDYLPEQDGGTAAPEGE